jgi:hypothetical protein
LKQSGCGATFGKQGGDEKAIQLGGLATNAERKAFCHVSLPHERQTVSRALLNCEGDDYDNPLSIPNRNANTTPELAESPLQPDGLLPLLLRQLADRCTKD